MQVLLRRRLASPSGEHPSGLANGSELTCRAYSLGAMGGDLAAWWIGLVEVGGGHLDWAGGLCPFGAEPC